MGLKMARPKWFDGTALCIGSMTPDFGYAISGYLKVDTHDWDGLWQIDLPLALLITIVVRWIAASVAAAHLPDLGAFRLHSWRVVHRRQPSWLLTITSCALGALTHVALDSFTHPGRAGVRWLGYDDVEFHLWGVVEPLASALQLIGHTLGSMVGLWMLLIIGKRHLLEQWYSADDVDRARHFLLRPPGRLVFWGLVAAGVFGGAWWGWNGDSVERIQRPAVGGILAVCVACAVPICRPTTSPVLIPGRVVPREPQPR